MEDHISVEQLSLHLQNKYLVQVDTASRLDLNVFRINITGANWVARVYPQTAAYDLINSLAKLLDHLRQQGFPAEELASSEPVTELSEPKGCVMVTKFVEGDRPERNRATFHKMGDLLGQLHKIAPSEWMARGGAWHHLSLSGGIEEECDAATRMLENVAVRLAPNDSNNEALLKSKGRLADELYRIKHSLAQDMELPTAIVHPDFVIPNIIAQPQQKQGGTEGDGQGEWTVVDWTGAGIGVRVLSLGMPLASAAARGKMALVDAFMKGYASHVTLERIELERLPQAIRAHLLTIKCWEVGMGRTEVESADKELAWLTEMSDNVARRVRRSYSR